MNDVLTRAETFIWKNARLLERQRFAFHFRSGSRGAVLAALAAYRNEDGGFGNALEPDIRCPDSQPVPVQHALEIMDEVGFDEEIAQRACDFLLTITTGEGGVPFVLPSVQGYPHAPWWSTKDDPPASLNPTAALAGLLHKHHVHHPWLEGATLYCWENIPDRLPEDMHEMAVVLTFLHHVQGRDRAERELERLQEHLLSSGLVAGVHESGYVKKPLDWAPTPDHPCRSLFSDEVIGANLDELIAQQQEDGGWLVPWPALSPGCELAWRSWVSLGALRTLRAYGRLES
ncbi:MAG: hypothetical protein M3498_03725 [Deinococcota bacterium]|nr:hypothetical protein [Deinococcota bacterium]MDQ3458404.1 hypothetical protein [Deinococcota bacterium]